MNTSWPLRKRGAERDYIVLKLCCGADGSSTHVRRCACLYDQKDLVVRSRVWDTAGKLSLWINLANVGSASCLCLFRLLEVRCFVLVFGAGGREEALCCARSVTALLSSITRPLGQFRPLGHLALL